jgi:hypothetical protein
LNSCRKTVMSGMTSALASVMLQRAYARPRPSGSPDAIAAAQRLLEPRAEPARPLATVGWQDRRRQGRGVLARLRLGDRPWRLAPAAKQPYQTHQHRHEDDYQSGHQQGHRHHRPYVPPRLKRSPFLVRHTQSATVSPAGTAGVGGSARVLSDVSPRIEYGLHSGTVAAGASYLPRING